MNSRTGVVENEPSARPNEHELKSAAFELRVFCLCNASIRALRGSVTLGSACKSKGDLGGCLLTSLLSPRSYSAMMLQRNSSKSSLMTLLMWRSQTSREKLSFFADIHQHTQ